MTRVRKFEHSLLFLLWWPLTLLTSCGLDQETNVETGDREQILHFGNADEPQELDPHVTTGIPEFQIQHALFEGLVAKHPKTLAIEPGVAESWTISADLMTYTFNLRKNARWSNGDIITAGDFVYSARGRNCKASAICGSSMRSLVAKSAIVRLTFKIRL